LLDNPKTIKRLGLLSQPLIIYYINPFIVRRIPAIQLMIEITIPTIFRILSVL